MAVSRSRRCPMDEFDSRPEKAVYHERRAAQGDSLTLTQLGVPDAIKARGQNEFFDPFEVDAGGKWPPAGIRNKMMLDTFSADVFITGSNAVTLDGKLVNVDGSGNRVAAMIYGPKKVILAVGVNKIVENAD